MKRLLYLSTLLILASCNKYELNRFQRDVFNTYSVGDTLVFQSTKTNELRYFVITYKYNIIDKNIIDGNYREAEIQYRDLSKPINTDKSNTYRPTIVSMGSNQYGDYIFVKFNDFFESYNDNFGLINITDTIRVLNKKIINYYTLNNTDNRDSTIKIIWQKKYGIVQFDLRKGESFVRVNIP